MITQDLGIATAYGYAKSKGYTGTEAEFAELMASYASTAQTAIEAADRAVEANTAAQSAKTDAAASKTAAQTAAQTATTAASGAGQSASTATTKASEASQSASTASAAATSAITSAQTATTASATATTKASEASESATTAITAKTDAETARDAAAQSASEAAASAESVDPDEFNRKIYAAFATDTASGSIAHFEDGADSIPMKDVLVHIEPVQAGSGDPSPENVRPITGWTGAKVTRHGKNLCESLFSDGKIPSISNGALVNANQACRSDYIPVNGGSVTFSCKNTSSRITYCFLYGENKDFLLYGNSSGNSITATHADAKYAMIRCDGGTTAPDESMLELGSTATDYEPYSGQTYDITFPSEAGTVYGGTLDVTKGELVVDRAMVDLGTLTWAKHASLTNVFQSYRPNSMLAWKAIPNGSVADAICDIYKLVSSAAGGTDAVDMSIALGTGTSTIVYTHDSRFNDVADYTSAMSGVQFCYKLATPITYQLTPQEITSLLGANNVWADTGNTKVEYRASTKMYIDKKITEAVSALS